ncbi:high-affinity branched-chain amino acid ABC transporter permease LivM [Desulfobulbus rhabdoformis]|uniref:high-affinity branched-chain amino acid ABC transporter permease LivM n=1 Tax=Desulfobulbus rhabdoformis TaxID=34032 RepID=UPI0019660A75|nr:high-affinity branched-chain amino acid ABC transporter permease LivM [Desulfobulbus rhabdoformis]MBM9613889.1 high-affinity branched-chain amino acid ABC transporter permease LivM [Desulfobulbus rhabdoformis]
MLTAKDVRQALLIGLWFMFLTFPLLVIKVNTIEDTIIWRWNNMFIIGGVCFVATLALRSGRRLLVQKKQEDASLKNSRLSSRIRTHLHHKMVYLPLLSLVLLFFILFPTQFSTYQTTIMTTALMYVVLGLGLNIVVGVAGLLDLGYVAFYAVGAYSYALLNLHFGLGFWTVLPVAGLLAALFGVLLGFPVLRLRGDYLAIVTLGFGEIIRMVLENWSEFSHGPSGISNIPRPGLFGLDLSLNQSIIYTYYLMMLMVAFTIFVVNRLQNSRIGRAWFALREDDIACQAMGIDKTRTKLTAFALGAFWAGMAGVFFAAQNTYVSPKSFTFLESAIILCVVVLGGMGSIIGIILGALILILLPEYLRAISDYRMLVFGATLVLMMIFRPQGIISTVRRTYTLKR